MKKRSLFIVVAMVLLLAVVLGMGGTTFAKYITTKDIATDSATVAKWGYVIEGDATDLFSAKYASGVKSTASSVDVWGSTDKVAPGTSGSFEFSITGTAEVDAQVTVTVNDEQTVTISESGAVVYEPILWSVSLNGTKVDSMQFVDLATLVDYLENLDADYPTNHALDDTYTVSWVWLFDDADATAKSTTRVADADDYDTYLGDAAKLNNDADDGNDVDDVNLTVALGVSIKVEQIQAGTATTDKAPA